MNSFIVAILSLTFAVPAASAQALSVSDFAAANAVVANAAVDPAASVPKKKSVRKKVANKTKSKGVSTHFERGSEETVAERSTRLKRECKGRVNAGACAGYTD
jgi:hypothetical protein